MLVGLGALIGLGIVECYLRLFDPFPLLVRGGRIDLPVYARYSFSSHQTPGLDDAINVSFNSLGFRGPEPPKEWEQTLTIVCVGGSTTQCLYLSDGSTWPDRLNQRLQSEFDNVWVNNAGIDGHSTFGHLLLLEQYLSARVPKILLFYVGLNDVDRLDLNRYDAQTLRIHEKSEDTVVRRCQRALLENSDAFALFDNLRLQYRAHQLGLKHDLPVQHRGFSTLPEATWLSEEQRRVWLSLRDPRCLSSYRDRLKRIIRFCDDHHAHCVLLTQAVLYGEGKDEISGLDLETVRVGDVDGWTHWQLLKEYNRTLKEVAAEEEVSVIDIASQIPKSSQFFYDLTHFNREGAFRMADSIYAELRSMVRDRGLTNQPEKNDVSR